MITLRHPEPDCPAAIVEAGQGLTLDGLDQAGVIKLFQEAGAILFRGFGADLDAFGRFARRFCATAVHNESPGREVLDRELGIQTVNAGQDPFPLHPELSREPWKPDAAFFGCLSAPALGGETTICDGIALARALPPAVRQGLEGRRLVYLMPTWPELFAFWLGTPSPSEAQLASPPPTCPYRFVRTPDGRIMRMFSRPALHKPLFAPGPAFGNFLLFSRFYNGRGDFPLLDDLRPVPEEWLLAIQQTGEALSHAVEWQQGDVLMLDNSRFLHGRRAVLSTAERRIATYFGYLGFAPRDPEEPELPPWREADFTPPAPPAQRA